MLRQSALHRIELASTDDDEVEFFSTCAAGDRISIVFYLCVPKRS